MNQEKWCYDIRKLYNICKYTCTYTFTCTWIIKYTEIFLIIVLGSFLLELDTVSLQKNHFRCVASDFALFLVTYSMQKSQPKCQIGQQHLKLVTNTHWVQHPSPTSMWPNKTLELVCLASLVCSSTVIVSSLINSKKCRIKTQLQLNNKRGGCKSQLSLNSFQWNRDDHDLVAS